MIADVAVIAVTGLNLAIVYLNHKRDLTLIGKLADRVRVVNPAKAPAVEPEAAPAVDLSQRRAG